MGRSREVSAVDNILCMTLIVICSSGVVSKGDWRWGKSEQRDLVTKRAFLDVEVFQDDVRRQIQRFQVPMAKAGPE